MFCRAVLDSLAYLWNFGEEMDPFLLILSKIVFFFPLVFLLVLPYFLEKEKQGRSYFYYYNINKKNYYLLVDVVTFVAYYKQQNRGYKSGKKWKSTESPINKGLEAKKHQNRDKTKCTKGYIYMQKMSRNNVPNCTRIGRIYLLHG